MPQTTTTQTIQLEGKSYVILPRDDYERMAQAAALPALPEPDASGNVPAVAYARASLARKIISQRQKIGLNQRELAKLAGMPVETLCRIERGQQTPSTASIVKIDRALTRAARQRPAA